MIVGTNAFRWSQEYQLLGSTLDENLEEAIASAARAGLEAWEPIGLPTDEYAARLGRALSANGMRLASAYVNCRLHDEGWPASVETVLTEARRARSLGATIICTNPEPVSWGEPVDKTDDQLSIQLGAMFTLCQRLQTEDMRLAYHVHGSELRRKGREFRYMMDNLPAPLMDFCLDTHWIYRGYGNSKRAVSDVLKRYGNRIISLHIRQSEGGVWTEPLRGGDVDYAPVRAFLRETAFDGPLYIELGYEEGTPRTLSLEESHRQSVAWVRERLL